MISRHPLIPNRAFVRHYVEMVAAMFLGMLVLGMPVGWLLERLGDTAAGPGHHALMLTTMAVEMTVPMVAWMRYRGHAWRPCAEMSASMLVPAAAAVVLVQSSVAGFGAVMIVEHVAMLAGMLAAMLLRRSEYSCSSSLPAPTTVAA